MGRAIIMYPSTETGKPMRAVLPADGDKWLSASPATARWLNREWDEFEPSPQMVDPNPVRHFARSIGATVVEDGYEPLPEGYNA